MGPVSCIDAAISSGRLSEAATSYGQERIARAMCAAAKFLNRSAEDARTFDALRKSRWPHAAEHVEGGLEHVVSVDNGASYAELWARGDGNWYVLTEPVPTTAVRKDAVERVLGASIWEIPGVYKGMDLDRVMPRFLARSFGSIQIAGGSGDCGCK